jgi:hypothetical protein
LHLYVLRFCLRSTHLDLARLCSVRFGNTHVITPSLMPRS